MALPTNIAKDSLFNLEISLTDQKSVEDVLKIKKSDQGTVNDYNDGSTIIINSDRLILNSKKDYLMLCGAEGIVISTPKTLHVDCDDDIYLFSNTELYLGLPNRGEEFDFGAQRPRVTKADPTPDIEYEPLVLGIKLANWLEDLTRLLQQTQMQGDLGSTAMTPNMVENFKALQARIPEMVSTYAFVDGVSHQPVRPYKSSLTTPSGNQGTSQNQGQTVGNSILISSQQQAPTVTSAITLGNNPVLTTPLVGNTGAFGGPYGASVNPSSQMVSVAAVIQNPNVQLSQPSTNPDSTVGNSGTSGGGTANSNTAPSNTTGAQTNNSSQGAGWTPSTPVTQPQPQHILVDVPMTMTIAPLDKVKKIFGDKGEIKMYEDTKAIVYKLAGTAFSNSLNLVAAEAIFNQRLNDLSGGRIEIKYISTGGVKKIGGEWKVFAGGTPGGGTEILEVKGDNGAFFTTSNYSPEGVIYNVAIG